MRTFVYVVLAVLIIGGFALYLLFEPENLVDSEPAAPLSSRATPAPAPAPIQPTAAGEGVEPANELPMSEMPEDEEDEAATDAEQVLEAIESLKSTDPEERIAGVEQLAAYPTADAEQQLVATMETDPDADVRGAAATSLGQFDNLTDASLAALLNALEDANEDAQISALDAIESIAADLDSGAERFKWLIAELKTKKSAQKLKAETRRAIGDFLEDQAPQRR